MGPLGYALEIDGWLFPITKGWGLVSSGMLGLGWRGHCLLGYWQERVLRPSSEMPRVRCWSIELWGGRRRG